MRSFCGGRVAALAVPAAVEDPVVGQFHFVVAAAGEVRCRVAVPGRQWPWVLHRVARVVVCFRCQRSLVVLTGAHRVRGTSTGRAPGVDPIATPIALSSWITRVLDGSLGSTVLRLTMTGSTGA
jgi:hypothetical protein